MFPDSKHHISIITAIFLAGIFWIGVVGCSPQAAESATPLSTSLITESTLPPPTDMPEPSPTAQPGWVILLAPPGADSGLIELMKRITLEMASQGGFEYQDRSELTDADWIADVRLVVALPPDPGLQALAAAHPETQFLAVRYPDMQPSSNLSVLGNGLDQPDIQGFLAGYLAAVITPDWRVGVIARSDTTNGKAAQAGFFNGTIFYCGLCRPAYPPFYQYPVYAGINADAGQVDQQAAADLVLSNSVKTVYVAPGAGDVTLLEYLAESNVNIIGSISPPVQLQDQWVATIQVDLEEAAREAIPRILNGEGGQVIMGSVQFSNPNESLFSPGRQSYVERMLEDLTAGFIDTGVDPNTGDLR